MGRHETRGLSVKSNVHVYPADGVARRTESLLSLWNLETGFVEALISARTFNDFRTAGGLAAGARRLVEGDPRNLVVFGTGKIAAPATGALLHAFPSLRQITIAGSTAEKAEAFAARLAGEAPFLGRSVSGVGPEAARRTVAAASIVVTVTTASEPVVFGADVAAGALVILAGANRPDAREADDDLIRRATIYCDLLDAAVDHAGDLALARSTGALEPERALLSIGSAGRKATIAPALVRAPDAASDIIVFKSMGLGEQDLLLARALVDRARSRGVGLCIDTETGVHAMLPAPPSDRNDGEIGDPLSAERAEAQ